MLQFTHVNQEQQDSIHKAFTEVRLDMVRVTDKMGQLAIERSEDLQSISELLKDSSKQTITEVMTDVQCKWECLSEKLSRQSETLMDAIQKAVEDKVRVDEVQDALRRLTENLTLKSDSIRQELTLQIKNEESLSRMNKTFE
jgi:hypothetical protein